MVDLHVALAALALDGEGVDGTHAWDVGNANLLVVFACLHLQRDGSFHTQRAKIVNGSLDGGVVAALSYGVVAALACCHANGGSDGGGYVNGSTVDHDAVERGAGCLSDGCLSVHVDGQPEVVGTCLGNVVGTVELLAGREVGAGPRLIDVLCSSGLAVGGHVEGSDGGWCQLALGLNGNLQHLHVGLSL